MFPMAVAHFLKVLSDETDAFLAIKVVTRIRFDVDGCQDGRGICCWGNLLKILEFGVATAVKIIGYQIPGTCAVLVRRAESRLLWTYLKN